MRIEDRRQETMQSMEVAGDPDSKILQRDNVKLIEGILDMADYRGDSAHPAPPASVPPIRPRR